MTCSIKISNWSSNKRGRDHGALPGKGGGVGVPLNFLYLLQQYLGGISYIYISRKLEMDNS